jgi:hypothetical protein
MYARMSLRNATQGEVVVSCACIKKLCCCEAAVIKPFPGVSVTTWYAEIIATVMPSRP